MEIDRQGRRPLNWERLIRVARAYDAVENGGMYRNRWGQRSFNPVENPYQIVAAHEALLSNAANLRIAAGVSLDLGSSVIEGAAQTPKEVGLLKELQRRQNGQGFGAIEVTRYAPGRRPETFYRKG